MIDVAPLPPPLLAGRHPSHGRARSQRYPRAIAAAVARAAGWCCCAVRSFARAADAARAPSSLPSRYGRPAHRTDGGGLSWCPAVTRSTATRWRPIKGSLAPAISRAFAMRMTAILRWRSAEPRNAIEWRCSKVTIGERLTRSVVRSAAIQAAKRTGMNALMPVLKVWRSSVSHGAPRRRPVPFTAPMRNGRGTLVPHQRCTVCTARREMCMRASYRPAADTVGHIRRCGSRGGRRCRSDECCSSRFLPLHATVASGTSRRARCTTRLVTMVPGLRRGWASTSCAQRLYMRRFRARRRSSTKDRIQGAQDTQCRRGQCSKNAPDDAGTLDRLPQLKCI